MKPNLKPTKQAEPVLLIIDGNHLAHRCRHAYSLSYQGRDVSVLYGFLKVLQSYIRRFTPYAVAVCWDGGTPQYRRALLPEYKANRHTDEDEVAWHEFNDQMDSLSGFILPLMGVWSVKLKGAEADDLIWHLTRLSCTPSIVVSGDKDLLQTINDKTRVFSPSKERMYTAKEIEDDFGVSVANFVHWRAIQGDSSDNIKGVPGIGDRTATKLFKEFGSLTAITNAAAGINPKGTLSGKLGENIRTFGLDRIAKNVVVMALFRDRVGARLALLHAPYCELKVKLAKNILLANGFISLLDMLGDLRLTKPELDMNARYPVVVAKARMAWLD